MQVAIITVYFDENTGQFNQQELQDFLCRKRIEKITEHFFSMNNKVYLSFVVYYTGHHNEQIVILADKEKTLYNRLREWRNTTAKNLGFSPFIVLTNNQLKQIVKLYPEHLSEIQKIKGIGQSRIEKYGQDILQIVKEFNLNE